MKNVVDSLRRSGASIPIVTTLTKAEGTIQSLMAYVRFGLRQVCDALLRPWDVLYVHFPKRSAFPCSLFALLLRRPIILNFHGSDIDCSPFGRALTRFVVRRAALVVVPSAPFGRIVAERYRTAGSRIFASPSGGVDESFFGVAETHEQTTIGYVSRIAHEKGWETLFRALDQIKDLGWKAEFYGDGPDADRLRTLSRQSSLSDRITYYGPVAHELLPEVYRRFSIFVFPSERGYRESLGLVGLEAMASGVPVIGASTGGISSYVTDRINGFLFRPGDATDLADKLASFLQLPAAQVQRLRAAARTTADQYRREKVVGQLLQRIQDASLRMRQQH